MQILLVILLFTATIQLRAEPSPPSDVTFSALRYERDLKNQTSRGIGKAWIKKGDVLLEADELEVDYKTNEAIAIGNVHFKQGKMEVFSERGTYSLSGEKATMYNATVIMEQMVFSGKVIRRLSRDYFEMEEGLYTNCNTTPVLDRSVRQCYFDWKIYARRFDILIEGYLNAYDVILYAKDLPVTYLPYYRAPAKSKRQSGFLYPQFIAVDTLHGSGFSIPYFLVLNEWQDLTLSPDIYTKVGYHIGTSYRYAYSHNKAGEANFYFTQSRFPEDRSAPELMTKKRASTLGFIGEWAINLGNSYNLGGEAHSNQNLAIVSDPFYPRMYESDLGTRAELGYLKSQLSVTIPEDNWLYTGVVRYDQNLIMNSQIGTDNGPVGQLPSLGVFKKTSGIFNYFSYDIDARLNNYYRLGRSIDKVPDPDKTTQDSTPLLDPNDYIREGRRMQLEPRMVLNLPLPRGFEILPELKAGALLYNFDYGDSHFVDREYVDLQLPLSLYLSKRFSTDISGLEDVRHVFQPRFTYAQAIYRSDEPTHQFFYNGRNTKASSDLNETERLRRSLASPRFDILDQVLKYKYGRVDFIHNLYRRIPSGNEQFLAFSLGQQFNFITYDATETIDPLYGDSIGPVEGSLSVTLGKLQFQTQANYRIQKSPVIKRPTRENPAPTPSETDSKHNWVTNSSLSYSGPSESVTFNFLYRHNAVEADENATFTLGVSKVLPTFFNISAATDYTFFTGRFNAFSMTFNFAAKPYSCWRLDVTYALQGNINNYNYNTLVLLKFGLSFGGNIVFGL